MSPGRSHEVFVLTAVVLLTSTVVFGTACDDDDPDWRFDTGTSDAAADVHDEPMDTTDGKDTSDHDATPEDSGSEDSGNQRDVTSDAAPSGTPCGLDAGSSLVCGPHGVCLNRDGKYVCNCESGWVGVECRSRVPDTQ